MKKAIFNTVHAIYKTADRLAYYRKQAADCQQTRPDLQQYNDWRKSRYTGVLWSAPNNTRGEKGEMFTDSVDQYGEYIGDYWEVNRNIDNRGWFADNFQCETIKGGVSKLRTPRGTLYIPVVYYSDSDGTIHYINDCEIVEKGAAEENHEKAAKVAARSADYYAERLAEESREHHAKDRAEMDIEDARAEIHAVNKKALALLSEIKKHGTFSPAVCSALREKLADYLDDRARQFGIIDARKSDYWSAVY